MPFSQSFRRAIEHAAKVLYVTKSGDPNKPDFESDSYLRQIEDVSLCRAVYGGTKTVRAAGEEFLPRYPAEEEEDFNRRLSRAVLFNAFKRTAHGLVGMIFRKPTTWLDGAIGTAMAEHSLNLDMLGHDIDVMSRNLSIDAMVDGHVWVLVDKPELQAKPVSRLHEGAMGARPYWVPILKQDAINPQWETDEHGEPQLRVFAYRTTKSEQDGAYGEVEVECIRVLRPGMWEEHVRTKNGWQLVGEGTFDLDYIPVAFIPSNETAPFESEPPLLDVAYENIDHYQTRADHRWAALFASIPFPVFIGIKKQDVEWGANRALVIENPDGNAMLLESSGASLDSTRLDLKDSEARMAALGLQMLVGDKRSAETTESKLINKAESDSVLSAMARSINNGINRALAIHADWLGDEAPTLVLNNDFHERPVDATEAQALSSMVAQGQLSLETMWSALVAGSMLPDDFDAESERERLDEAEESELQRMALLMAGRNEDEDEDGDEVE